MQRLPKVADKNITHGEMELAKMLVQYYRHSFDVRRTGILNAYVDPPEVRELVNMIQWLGNGFGSISIGNHTAGLGEIIQTSAQELREMLEYIRTNGADRQIMQDLNFLSDQMEAADTLMGYLTND